MTDNDHNYHIEELDCVDRETLVKAGLPLGDWGYDAPGETRYDFYRRRGHNPADALSYALAWCHNAVEQAARRKDHLTGCAA
jgi:hypothetical protein